MAIEDNQILDRAMDAAEATIAESTPVEESPVHTEPEKTPSEQIKEDIETDKALKARDGKGKFTKAQDEEQISNDQDPEVETSESDTQVEEPVVEQSVEAPARWSDDEKPLFAKAPKEVQEVVARRELELQQIISRQGNDLGRYKPIVEKVNGVFAPYELKLKTKGLDPIQATERLLAWDAMFDKDFDGTILDLMKKHGRTPEYYLNMSHQDVGEQFQNQVPIHDPRVDEFKKELDSFKEQQKQATEAALNAELETFKSGKDSFGNERRKFVEMYEPQLAEAVQIVRREFPQLPKSQALHEAYEYIIGGVREAHGISKTPAPTVKTPEQLKALAKKTQAAASGLTGAPISGTAPKRLGAKNIDEAMDRAERRQGLH